MKKIRSLLVTAVMLAMILMEWGCTGSDSSAAQASGAATGTAKADLVQEKVDSEQGINTVKGTFMSLDMGDYMHFNMRADDGSELSFFVMEIPEEEIAPFEQGGMEGKSVEARWHTVTRDIPEAGGKMEIDELVSVRILD